ncbi:MAG: MBL fold metallo-hydrolase, partial [Desulfatiglandales bacterium]
MDAVKIHRIRLGTCNAYVIECGDSCILFDGGNRHREAGFFRGLDRLGISPGRIRLIIVSHVHFDHVGSLAKIREVCTCPVLVHKLESRLLASGKVVVPPGATPFGRLVSGVGTVLQRRGALGFEPVQADILFEDPLELSAFHVPGRLIHTPGHTGGSISLVLENGMAVVGDLVMNYLPLGLGPVFPPFAEDVGLVLKNWK